MWIKEVEMVDSVDDLKIFAYLSEEFEMDQTFEVLDARIASALNKIIQNTRFKKKVSMEEMKAQKEDRFLRGRQIAHLIYEYFRVTGANDSVEKYADLFTVALRNDDRKDFDSKWDGYFIIWWRKSHLMKSWWSLVYIENSRVWETQDRFLELCDLEIHQKKSSTWLSQIEDDGKKKYQAESTK